ADQHHEVVQRNPIYRARNFGKVSRRTWRSPSRSKNVLDNLFQTRIFITAGVKFDQPGCTVRVKEKPQSMLSGRFCGCERIEGRACANLEVLSVTLISGWPRRNHF